MGRRSAYWLAGLAAVWLCALPAAAADLALKRVVLSTGGVGYFEYEAAVDGRRHAEPRRAARPG